MPLRRNAKRKTRMHTGIQRAPAFSHLPKTVAKYHAPRMLPLQ